jgi:hypothetical protein
MGTILANVPPDTGAVKKAVKKVAQAASGSSAGSDVRNAN